MLYPPRLRTLLSASVCATAISLMLPAMATGQEPASQADPEDAVEEGGEPPSNPEAPGFRLQPISITATRRPMPADQVPASVTILEREQMELLQPTDLDDLLFGMPNVSVQSGPRASAQQPLIRGLGAERVIVLVDGIRQNFQSGHNGRFVIDPELLGRVEVVRGTGSALYGSGALGGVLAFETLKPRDLTGGEDGFGGWVRGSYSSATEGFGGSGVVYGQADGFEALLAGSHRDTDDIRLGDGSRLAYSALETRDLLAQFAITAGQGHRFEAGFESYRDDGIQPNTLESDDTIDLTDRTAERGTFRLGYSWEGEHRWWWDPDVTVYRTSFDATERFLDGGEVVTRTVETIGVDASNTFAFDFGDPVSLDLTVGIDHFQDDNAGDEDGAPLESYPDGTGSFTGLYAQAAFRLFDRVSVIPGVRWDHFEMEADDPDNPGRSGEEWSPKLAVSADVTDFLTVFGSYAEGFNAPRHQYLYISGLHFPGGGPIPDNFFVANPELDPERSETWEVGARLGFEDVIVPGDSLAAELVYFDTHATDFIAVSVDVFGGTTNYENLDEVDLDGIEATLRYDQRRWFAALGYGQVRARETNGDWVDGVPGDQWSAEAGVRFFDGDLTLGWRSVYVETQNRVTDIEAARDSYWVNDAYALWDLDVWSSNTQLELRANNLFDEDYMPSGAYVLSPGVDVRVGLRVGF